MKIISLTLVLIAFAGCLSAEEAEPTVERSQDEIETTPPLWLSGDPILIDGALHTTVVAAQQDRTFGRVFSVAGDGRVIYAYLLRKTDWGLFLREYGQSTEILYGSDSGSDLAGSVYIPKRPVGPRGNPNWQVWASDVGIAYGEAFNNAYLEVSGETSLSEL